MHNKNTILYIILWLVSGIGIVFSVYYPPNLTAFLAWNASVTSNSSQLKQLSKKMQQSTLYYNDGLYYEAYSNLITQDTTEENLTIAYKILKENFNLLKDTSTIEYSKKFYKFYDLLGYIHFYKMNYNEALAIYWTLLRHNEKNDNIRHNYELTLFFLQSTALYSSENTKTNGSQLREDNQELQEDIPRSLFQLKYGTTYYPVESTNSKTENLPQY